MPRSRPRSPRMSRSPISHKPIPLGTFGAPIGMQRMSCFGAGTMVRTLTGSEPIESLKLGDQVLTQSIKTGALAYKPILSRAPQPTQQDLSDQAG